LEKTLKEYAGAGEKFEVAWEDGENALMRVYTKDLNGETKIRRERQEYPNKRFDEAIEEKLPTVIKMRAVGGYVFFVSGSKLDEQSPRV